MPNPPRSELESAVSTTRQLLGAAACSCALVSADGSELTFAAADGKGAEAIVGVTLPLTRGIAGWVALTGQPIAVADVAKDKRFAEDVAESTAYVPTSILAAPLVSVDGEVLGVLEVLDPQVVDDTSHLGGHHGTGAQLAVLAAMASQVASLVRLTAQRDALGDSLGDSDPA
ncbi:MAG: GAF domain-containing protein, partial [Nocardioides sp.]